MGKNREFSQWLTAAMEEQDVQAVELAALLGVTEGAVSRWKNGQSVPKNGTMRDLARIFQVDLLQLMALANVPGVRESGIPPLGFTTPAQRQESVREELDGMGALTPKERVAMLSAYERYLLEQEIMLRPVHETATLLRKHREHEDAHNG